MSKSLNPFSNRFSVRIKCIEKGIVLTVVNTLTDEWSQTLISWESLFKIPADSKEVK